MEKLIKIIWAIVLLPIATQAQEVLDLDKVVPGRFDQGKMWTFENPPVAYFEEAYGFTPTQEWMDDVRKSALRFSSWCSASFISESGLIMTNHHCSRSVVASVMKEGENFDNEGFYAETVADERQVPDLYVDQLWMIADITDAIKSKKDISVDSALTLVTEEYKAKEEWAGLKTETRTFYSGGKYSLYGFKTFSDVRLVLYPELALGFYGGDPDNFTYPRYNLDFTFFRAYDEEGNPLQATNYYEFNPKGAEEGDVVFVVGNPGSTGRYKTMAELYYDRDAQVPVLLAFLEDRIEILMAEADKEEDIYVKDSITNIAFSLSNGQKAYSGRLKGLTDEFLMTKKSKKEQMVRGNTSVETDDPWIKIEDNVTEASQYVVESFVLSPSPYNGKINGLLFALAAYKEALKSEDEVTINTAKEGVTGILKGMDRDLAKTLLATVLDEWVEYTRRDAAANFMEGISGTGKAEEIFKKSIVLNSPEKFFALKANKLDKEPLMAAAELMTAEYKNASQTIRGLMTDNKQYAEKIMNLQFQLSGVSSPPDATFSLRWSDGVVKGYDYNGTEAPYKTTYFGLYDRFYSNDGKFPWNLPERWQNPPMELLKQPLNFVSTADIIGGNSGSPLINTKGEVIGLAFDGNIESLPGYFIFDDTYNRTVSVHSAGIAAAIKYIYKADRLMSELNIE